MKDPYKDDIEMQIARADRQGDIDFLKKVFLIKKHADILKVTENSWWNYLHLALNVPSMTPPETVQFYVDNGVDVNAQDGSGATPLHYAVHGNNIEAVKILLKAGADPNIQDRRNMTPFDESFGRKELNFELMEELLKFGADPNRTPSGGTRISGLKFVLENLVISEEVRADREQAIILLSRYGGHE